MEPKEGKEEVHSQEYSDAVGSRDSFERWDSDGGRQIAEEVGPKERDSDGEPSKDEHDAFSTENVPKVVLIQLARLYDLQLAFLTTINPELAAYIGSLHEHGEFFGPDPAILVD
jgi:hypothetical protein